MRTPTTSRRNLLRAAGGAGLALPFAGLLGSKSSHAATGTSPKRLLVLDMPNAVWRADWLPTRGRHRDAATGDATTFQFGAQSAFFEKIRQHITFIEGVPIARPGGDPHVAG